MQSRVSSSAKNVHSRFAANTSVKPGDYTHPAEDQCLVPGVFITKQCTVDGCSGQHSECKDEETEAGAKTDVFIDSGQRIQHESYLPDLARVIRQVRENRRE